MTIRVGQLSDTHFLERGEEPEGGFAYDVDAAFELIRADMAAHDLDLVVVTGDVADHGRPAQYRRAMTAFEQLPATVAVTPGNHDQDAAFRVGMGATKVGAPRVTHLGNWCFAYVDSNVGLMVDDGSGHRIDPDYHQRLWGNGLLGSSESAWLRQVCHTTDADHVFVWVHHPPGTGNGAVAPTEEYEAEWRALLGDLSIIKGIGAGHTHMPTSIEFAGRPVHVCPSLKNNFDLGADTLLPPGWRSYEFEPDGTVTSEVQLIDDDRWPRHPLPRSVAALLHGHITHEQFDEIVARRQARDSS